MAVWSDRSHLASGMARTRGRPASAFVATLSFSSGVLADERFRGECSFENSVDRRRKRSLR